jgi:Ca-activated chloride channel homolog
MSILPILLTVWIIMVYLFWLKKRNYFKWVKKYWFYDESFKSKLSFFLFCLGMLGVSLALLDLRGPESLVESEIGDQRTIIIIDSSTSMLAEDVRPNRYSKALMIARHFVKKAVGHQIAVVLFSDIQKRLIPFTDDIDHLDSRIAALEGMDIKNGGSNIEQAITESVRYFVSTKTGEEKVSGNILLITDSEKTSEFSLKKLPEGVSLVSVGVGTRRGAKIPLRDRYGSFRGYKKYKGSEVVSKLDEDFLKMLAKKVTHYKYWVVNSYDLPTEKIINFFREIYKKRVENKQTRIRPVFSHFIMIPSLFILMLSYLISLGRSTFIKPACLIFLISANIDLTYALDKEEIIEQHKNGEARDDIILRLAETYLREEEYEKALTLFRENIDLNKENSAITLMNYGTALIHNKKENDGLKLYRKAYQLFDNLADGEIDLKLLRSNTLLAFSDKGKGEGKGQDEKKDKDKDKDKGKDKAKDEGKSKDGKNESKDKDDQSKGGKGKEGKKGKQDKKSDKKDKQEKNEEKSKKDKNGKDEKEKESENSDKKKKSEVSKPETLGEREERIRKKRKMSVVPAILKQIMNEDRNLQKKILDTSTSERKTREKKDW